MEITPKTIAPMKVENYHVKLLIMSGGYEKRTDYLVTAQSGEYAGLAAIDAECHSKGASLMPDEFWHDPCGEFKYQVTQDTLVTPEEANVMGKYLQVTSEPFLLLKLLINVMERVVESELAFDVHKLYENIPDAKNVRDIHTCGTAACVGGYGAIDPNTRTYLGFPPFELDGQLKIFTAETLLDELGIEIGAYASAICLSEPHWRKDSLILINFPEELEEHAHIVKDNPTAQDALDFMKAVLLQLIGEYEAEDDE